MLHMTIERPVRLRTTERRRGLRGRYANSMTDAVRLLRYPAPGHRNSVGYLVNSGITGIVIGNDSNMNHNERIGVWQREAQIDSAPVDNGNKNISVDGKCR